MTNDSRRSARLPALLAGRYRPRVVEPGSAEADGEPSLVAYDTVLGRDVALVRVGFGPERGEARDAFVQAMRARTSVLAPALVAIHDAGAWEDDAFLLLEEVRGAEPIEAALSDRAPPLERRLGWIEALIDAALALDRAGLALPQSDWASVALDAYGVPRVSGLDHAVEATAEARAEAVRALGLWIERLAPAATSDGYRDAGDALGALVDAAARGAVDLGELDRRWRALRGEDGASERPLLHVDAERLARRERVTLLFAIAGLVLAFGVLVLVLLLARR